MAWRARDAGNTLRTVAAVKFRDAGNVLRTAKTIRFRDAGNVLRTIFNSLSAALTHGAVNGAVDSASPQNISTNYVGASLVGGTGPFVYAWSRVDGGSDLWTISNPTGSATFFTALAVTAGLERTAKFSCTITDATGATAQAGPVNATVINLHGA